MNNTIDKAKKAELNEKELEAIEGGATRTATATTSDPALRVVTAKDPAQKVRTDDAGDGGGGRDGLSDLAIP